MAAVGANFMSLPVERPGRGILFIETFYTKRQPAPEEPPNSKEAPPEPVKWVRIDMLYTGRPAGPAPASVTD